MTKADLPRCVGCESSGLRSVRRYRTKTSYGRAVFSRAWLEECPACGLVQAVPAPDKDTLARYYERDYRRSGWYGSDVADTRAFPKDNLFYFNRGRSIAELLAPHVKKDAPRILDIGAGYGHILHALGERYPKSTRAAIEFSDVCVYHLQSLGFEVHTRPVEEVLAGMERRFDVVVLSHVLEHLLDPAAVLRLIHGSLTDDGVLYVEVPNIPRECLLRYPDNRWAPRFDEPHITFFSQETLGTLLRTTGFDPSFAETAGEEYCYISAARFHMPTIRSVLLGLMPPMVFRLLRRRGFTKPLRVHEHEPSFRQYGGFRIWIRSVSTKACLPAGSPADAGSREPVRTG